MWLQDSIVYSFSCIKDEYEISVCSASKVFTRKYAKIYTSDFNLICKNRTSLQWCKVLTQTFFNTRHPAETNMCKRLVFHYISLFSVIIITQSQPPPASSLSNVRNRCAKKLLFWFIIFVSWYFCGRTIFGHSIP